MFCQVPEVMPSWLANPFTKVISHYGCLYKMQTLPPQLMGGLGVENELRSWEETPPVAKMARTTKLTTSVHATFSCPANQLLRFTSFLIFHDKPVCSHPPPASNRTECFARCQKSCLPSWLANPFAKVITETCTPRLA